MNLDDVKDWVVTGVKRGGQFYRQRVNPGWRIRQVAIENIMVAEEVPDIYSRDAYWNDVKYYIVNKENRDMLKKHLLNGKACNSSNQINIKWNFFMFFSSLLKLLVSKLKVK